METFFRNLGKLIFKKEHGLLKELDCRWRFFSLLGLFQISICADTSWGLVGWAYFPSPSCCDTFCHFFASPPDLLPPFASEPKVDSFCACTPRRSSFVKLASRQGHGFASEYEEAADGEDTQVIVARVGGTFRNMKKLEGKTNTLPIVNPHGHCVESLVPLRIFVAKLIF